MKTANEIYFDQITMRDLTTMYNTGKISEGCLDRIKNQYMFYTDKEIALLDVGSMIAVVRLEDEEIRHFNKFTL